MCWDCMVFIHYYFFFKIQRRLYLPFTFFFLIGSNMEEPGANACCLACVMCAAVLACDRHFGPISHDAQPFVCKNYRHVRLPSHPLLWLPYWRVRGLERKVIYLKIDQLTIEKKEKKNLMWKNRTKFFFFRFALSVFDTVDRLLDSVYDQVHFNIVKQ